MNNFWFEIKLAFLSLRKKIGFSSSVITTMSIALGLLLCVLKLNYLLILEPLTYPEQEKLFVAKPITLDQSNDIQGSEFSYDLLLDFYNKQSAFSNGVISYYNESLILDNLELPKVNTIATSPEYFELFDVPMAIGSGFDKNQAVQMKSSVAVISYNSWKKYYNFEQDILQKKIKIGTVSYKIIGVIGEQFVEPQVYAVGRETDVWLPWDVRGEIKEYSQDYEQDQFFYIGKLKDEFTANQTQQVLSNLINRIISNPGEASSNLKYKIELISVQAIIIGNTKHVGILLLVGVLGLLLIASTNISNILFARVAEKMYQLSIFAATGAKKAFLYRTVFFEVLILMVISTLIAVFLAKTGFDIIRQSFSTIIPRGKELEIDQFMLLSALLLIFIFTVVFSKISIRKIDFKNLNLSLLASGKGAGFQVSSGTRNVLISAQVAVATTLVFINISLLQHSIVPIFKDKGLNVENVYEMMLTPHKFPFESAEARIALTRSIKKILLEQPEVDTISLSNPPFRPNHLRTLNLEDSNVSIRYYWERVDFNFFNLVEQKLIKGDNFSIADTINNNKLQTQEVDKNMNEVAIVNQSFAERLRADGDVLGMKIKVKRGEQSRIIGIVSDTINTSSFSKIPRVYTPTSEAFFSYLIRFKPNQYLSRLKLVSLIKKETSLYAPYSYQSTSMQLNKLEFAKIATAITTAFLAIAVLFLATVGIYGIISYSIQMRTSELGIRIAMGAKKKNILGLIVRDNASFMAYGFVSSVLIIFLIMNVFSDSLTGYIVPQMIVIFFITLILVFGIVLGACYLPLRKVINFPVTYSLRDDSR